MHLKTFLGLLAWFIFLGVLFSISLTDETIATDGLDKKVEPRFYAGSILRRSQGLPNNFFMEAKQVENTLQTEYSFDVHGGMDRFEFFCDKLTLDPKTGFLFEGDVRFIDKHDEKILFAPYAKMAPDGSSLKIYDNPIIIQKKGAQSKIRAKSVVYQKTSDGFEASLEGPIECVMQDMEIKEFAPFKRERPL